MAPSAIANKLGSDTQTVRGWLGLTENVHDRGRRVHSGKRSLATARSEMAPRVPIGRQR